MLCFMLHSFQYYLDMKIFYYSFPVFVAILFQVCLMTIHLVSYMDKL